MKHITAIIFTILTFNIAVSQDSAKILLQNEILSLLEQEGVLLTTQQKQLASYTDGGEMRWQNPRQKRRALEKDQKLRYHLQKYFALPSLCNDKVLRRDLIFRNRSIGKLGSYLIKNNNFIPLNNSEPELPVLWSGNQINIPNPRSDGSSYRLYFTSSKLFRAALATEVDGGIAGLFNAKLRQSFTKSNSSKLQISIGTGVFENQLGNLFKKVFNKQLQPGEFSPIYYVWLAYKAGQITPTDRIISNFEGMAFFSSLGVETDDELSFDANVSGAGKIPFLSGAANASANWSRSNLSEVQNNIYHVYMFNTPSLSRIPTPDEILQNWKTMSEFGSSINAAKNILPANAPLVINVKFGPIPNNEVLPLVKLDESYTLNNGGKFIKSIKLINDNNRIKPDETALFYTFDVEIHRDEDQIAAGQNLSGLISTEIPIRLFIDNPVKDKYFDIVFPKTKIYTDTYPTPYFTETDGYVLKADKDNSGNFVYKTKISFKCPDGTTIGTALRPLKVVDVFGLPTEVDPNLKKIFTSCIPRALGNNNYELKFDVPASKNYFDPKNRSYDLAILLDFGMEGMNYVRKLSLNVLTPDEVFASASKNDQNVIIKDNEQLINLLNPGAILRDGRKIEDVKSIFTKDNKIDVLPFIEEIKKQTNLSITSKNEYLISSIYLTTKT